MSKYRIIEETEFVSGEKSKTRFYIQEKFLTMWFNISLTFVSYLVGDKVVIIKEEPKFTRESEAKKILEIIKNPIKEIYKGCTLERIFDNEFNNFYINRDNRSWTYNGESKFEGARTIEELKRKIDKRDISHSYRIIKDK